MATFGTPSPEPDDASRAGQRGDRRLGECREPPERLTCKLDVEIVVSDDLVTRIQKECSPVDAQLGRLTLCGDVHLRGRVRPITVWTAQSKT